MCDLVYVNADTNQWISGDDQNITLPPMSVTSVQLLAKWGKRLLCLLHPVLEPEVKLLPQSKRRSNDDRMDNKRF